MSSACSARRHLLLLALSIVGLGTTGCGDHGGALARRPSVTGIDSATWYELRSPDFVLYSNGTRQDLEAFALDLSRFTAVVERLVDAQPPRTNAAVFLVNQHAEELFMGEAWAAGVMFNTLTGFDGLVRGVRHDPITRGVFLHEYTHYLTLRGNELDLPTWYVEGFAEFLETTRARDDLMEIGSVPAWRMKALEYRLGRKRDIDLRKIFAFERVVGARYPSEFYPISWATVHYLSSEAERHARMVAMIEAQGRGTPWREAYARAFDEPIEALSRDVQHHVEILLRGTPGTVGYLPIEALTPRTDFATRELPASEATLLLGELALRGAALRDEASTLRLAEALLEYSLQLDPDDSRTRAALAYAFSLQDQTAKAEPHLAAFRADPSPTFEALVHAGDALRAQAEHLPETAPADPSRRLHASAADLYLRALELAPDSPAALAGLGATQLETGAIEEARATLAKAQSLGEWDATLTLDRGRAEQKAGNAEAARAFWKQVIRLGSEEEGERARELLRTLFDD
jgi:hypothetical protein